MFNRENVEKVNLAFQEKRRRAQEEAKRRTSEVQSLIPELREVDREMASIGMRVFGEAIKGGDNLQERMDRLKEENRLLQKKHGDLLEKHGFPRDYTKEKPACEKCGDSGFIGSNMCICMKREIILEGYRTSGLGKLLEKQRFDNFDLSLYSSKTLPDKNYSARDVMEGIFRSCKDYAEKFTPSSPSLLLIGGTGLGKTHLSSAMAKEIIDKGFDVVYETVPNMISAFEKERFAKEEEKNRTRRYLEAELLIMDDLGTEPQGKSSQSTIYNLVNARASVYSRPTIISTNLSYRALEKMYDSPIISRLFGEFDVLLFAGEDVRRAKLSF